MRRLSVTKNSKAHHSEKILTRNGVFTLLSFRHELPYRSVENTSLRVHSSMVQHQHDFHASGSKAHASFRLGNANIFKQYGLRLLASDVLNHMSGL